MKSRHVSQKVRSKKVPRVLEECGDMVGPVEPAAINHSAHPDPMPNSLQSVSIEMEEENDENVAKEAYIAIKQEAISILAALATLAEEAGYSDEKDKVKKVINQLTEMI